MNPDPSPSSTPVPNRSSTPSPEPSSNPDPNPSSKPDPNPSSKPDPNPPSKPDPNPPSKPDPNPPSKPDPNPPSSPDRCRASSIPASCPVSSCRASSILGSSIPKSLRAVAVQRRRDRLRRRRSAGCPRAARRLRHPPAVPATPRAGRGEARGRPGSCPARSTRGGTSRTSPRGGASRASTRPSRASASTTRTRDAGSGRHLRAPRGAGGSAGCRAGERPNRGSHPPLLNGILACFVSVHALSPRRMRAASHLAIRFIRSISGHHPLGLATWQPLELPAGSAGHSGDAQECPGDAHHLKEKACRTPFRRCPTTTRRSSRTSTSRRCDCITTSITRPTSTALNGALEGTEWADKPHRGRHPRPPEGSRGQARRRAQQWWRASQPHAVLELMSPTGGGAPSGDLAKPRSTPRFGSFDAFKADFKAAGINQFGSGWAWLVKDAEGLKVVSTANQDNPVIERHGAAARRRRLGARLLPQLPEPAPGLSRRVVERRGLGRRRPALRRLTTCQPCVRGGARSLPRTR